MKEVLLKVDNVKKYFPLERGLFRKASGYVKAVDGISFTVHRGEILGVVGESGCGKSTLARLIVRLYTPDAGRIYFREKDINALNKEELKAYRRSVQMVFQDPYGSLNPRLKIGTSLMEPLEIHGIGDKRGRRERVFELLEMVGLDREIFYKYPHQLSGGQRQRVGIARALTLKPELIIADEPVSSLDVSVQAQILNLFLDLYERFHYAYIFISHDLRVVEYMCDYILVMYIGQVMESGPKAEIYKNPVHPYTKVLLDSIPEVNSGKKKALKVPPLEQTTLSDFEGCIFFNRCPFKKEICKKKPSLIQVNENHFVACHL